MSDQFVAEIRLVGFNFAPVGWALAAGQILPISQYTPVFSLVGTYYGGNGTSNFALPNLQGNVAIGQGQAPGLSSYVIGETGGSSTVTLLASEVPVHTHTFLADATLANQTSPTGNSFARTEGSNSIYAPSGVRLRAGHRLQRSLDAVLESRLQRLHPPNARPTCC